MASVLGSGVRHIYCNHFLAQVHSLLDLEMRHICPLFGTKVSHIIGRCGREE